MMARKMKDIDTEEELVETFSQQMRISKGEYELFLKVLISRWRKLAPSSGECLSHTPSTCHTCTALAFSLYTRRDIDSDYSHAHSSYVLHSPLSGSSVNESCAQSRFTANMVAERC